MEEFQNEGSRSSKRARSHCFVEQVANLTNLTNMNNDMDNAKKGGLGSVKE
jgi:hypothetical protein